MLFVGAILFLLCMLGVGLLISTVSGTQQQALVTSFFFFIMSGDVLGFWFSHQYHAVMAAVSDLCHSAALLLDRIAGYVPEGRWHGYSLTANAGDVLPWSQITDGSCARFHKALD